MFVIIIEMFLILKLNRLLEQKRIKLGSRLIIAILFQFVIVLIYRLNLDAIGREVYYSDAEVYWKESLILLNKGKLIGNQVGYAYFSAIIQFFSPFKSVVWNNISNVFLIDLAVLLSAYTMSLYDVNKENIKAFVNICIFNPLVIYSLGRNLKDALFIFLAVAIVFAYIMLEQKKNVIYVAIIIGLCIVISSVRPWGFLIVPMLIIEKLLTTPKNRRLRSLCLVVVIVVSFLIVLRLAGLWKHVELWMPIVFEKANSISPISLMLAPVKILTGPGPYRSLFGGEYFLFTTLSGNIFSAIGSVMWWWCLSTFIINFRKLKLKNSRYPFLIIALFFIVVYSMQYGGSLELRFRGVIYILTTAAFMSLCRGKYSGGLRKNTFFVFLGVSVGATFFSI